MKFSLITKFCAIAFSLTLLAPAQREDRDRVPFMRPDEERAVTDQADEFNAALQEVLVDAAKSTVRIWGNPRRPRILAYGTVVGDGSQVLTKWSEVERFIDSIRVQGTGEHSYRATVAGVFSDEDLVLLDLQSASGRGKPMLTPAKFYPVELGLGRFITASQPNGKAAAFGVVSVLERNLRETDQAHLGIMADAEFRGEGVRIANVQPEYGAAEAGLRGGDVILKVDDRTISGLQELKNALSSKHPGDTVVLHIESAGREHSVEVFLSNRPVTGQFSGGRLNEMERMGGELNKVRGGFSQVVQSDMRIDKDHVGGPIADLDGRIVGITMARADRTRTYVMGSAALLDLLKTKPDTVAEAREKQAERQQMLARQQEFRPRFQDRPRSRPRDAQRMRRQLNDTDRLMERMRDEMEMLGQP